MSRRISFTLGDKPFEALPSFEAIERIERDCGRSISALASDFIALRATEIVTILHHAITAAGMKPTRNEIGELVCNAGVIPAAEIVNEILSAILRASPEDAPAEGDTKSGGD